MVGLNSEIFLTVKFSWSTVLAYTYHINSAMYWLEHIQSFFKGRYHSWFTRDPSTALTRIWIAASWQVSNGRYWEAGGFKTQGAMHITAVLVDCNKALISTGWGIALLLHNQPLLSPFRGSISAVFSLVFIGLRNIENSLMSECS